MVKNADEIYNELKLIDMQCTGNCVEALDTYSVKSKRITLYVGRTQSGNSYRYAIGVVDVDTKESAEAEVLFGYYPSKNVGHATFLGTPVERILVSNSGMMKNIYEILKAIGRLYNLPVERKHY